VKASRAAAIVGALFLSPRGFHDVRLHDLVSVTARAPGVMFAGV
jgi:hypothetical protein